MIFFLTIHKKISILSKIYIMRTISASRFLAIAVIVTGLCLATTGKAQQIENPGFENWSQVTFFEEPDSFYTSNMQAYFTTGVPNVFKTTDSHQGNFAARLESIQGDWENIPGVLLLGNAGSMGLSGGIPYTGMPDSISVWAKYEPMPPDTAMIMVFFKQMGNIIGVAGFQIFDQLTDYTRIVNPVEWFLPGSPPDSLLLIAFSSDPDGMFVPGSELFLDDIEMTGTTQQIPNNGFEDWTALSFEEPDDWFTSNMMTYFGSGIGITKDTDHVEGMYSAKIINRSTMDGDILSFVTNGNVGEGGPAGGSAVLENPEKITFYYKYSPANSDTGLALGMLSRYDAFTGSTVICDSVMVKLPPEESWTFFEVSFNYSGIPPADTVLFAAAAGMIDDTLNPPQEGSILWIDMVAVEYPVAVSDIRSNSLFSVFPNPARDEIRFTGPVQTARRVEILTPDGCMVRSCSFTSPPDRILLNMNGMNSGLYLYRIYTEKQVHCGKFSRL